MRARVILIMKRAFAYSALFMLLGFLAHLYVVYPLYVKKIPYFSHAVIHTAKISCTSGQPEGLSRILRYTSLPFFALEGQVVFVDQSGRLNICSVSTSAPEERVYRLASLTKALTTFAILDLAESGRVELDAYLVDVLSEVADQPFRDPNVPEVRIQHLLSHSSGLGGPFGSDNMVKEGVQPWCPYDLTELTRIRLAGKPGSRHLYSNVAYCLLGEVIHRASGQAYKDYIEHNYFSGFPSLDFAGNSYLPGEPVYDFSNDYMLGERYKDWLDFEAIAPAAGLIGNPQEFARLIWGLNQKHPDVLYAEGVEHCWESDQERCYSNTFVVYDAADNQRIGVQQGYLPGSSSLVAVASTGEVLVWVAPGAPLEGKYRMTLENRVVSFLSERMRQSSN